MSASPDPTPISVTCPLCKGDDEEPCSLCGNSRVLSPQVARVAEAVMEHLPIPGPEDEAMNIVASHLKFRVKIEDLPRDVVYDIDDILEIKLQARVLNVSFDVHEPTGEIHRNHSAKIIEVVDIDHVASPKDWT